MTQETAYDPRDLTVHFRDLALYLLRRWRWLLGLALAGAVTLCALGYLRSARRYEAGQSAPAPITSLSADARARVASVMGYGAAYQRVCAYNESAPLMQVDPGAAPTRRMRLLITGEGCWAAACLYREYVVSETLYEDLPSPWSAAQGVQAAYLAELVTVAVESEPADRAARQVFLTVQVLAPTETLCQRLSDAVRQTVDSLQTTVAQETGAHVCRWVFDGYALLRDETVATHQQKSLEEQTALRDRYEEVRRTLTAAEEEYVLRLTGQSVTDAASPPPSVSVSAALWGGLLGLCVGGLWFAVRYLFCGRVLSAADTVSRHGVFVLGSLGQPWGPLGRRLQDAPLPSSLLGHRLALAAVSAGVGRLYLSAPAACHSRLAESVAVSRRQGLTVSVGADALTDGDAASQLASCDGFAAAVQVGTATHRRLAEELALARRLGCRIVGVILLY